MSLCALRNDVQGYTARALVLVLDNRSSHALCAMTCEARADSMVDDVRRVLTETNLNPRNLKLEITEYTAMCEADKTIEIMRALSNMGIQISIDDFGTGYSSLSYLKRYPVHTLKMDKYFVDHVADNEEDASFARMVIGIAKSLNLDLIAEGVETKEQLDFLYREGCRLIQGKFRGPARKVGM